MFDALLPPNATAQEYAMDAAVARVGDVPVPVRDVWDAAVCPDALLPWLAWAYSVDDWDATWTPAQRRGAISRAVQVHRYKGTIGAVRDALGALGYGVQVQEWFNQLPAGEAYTFRILLTSDQVGIDLVALAKIFQVVDSSKNLRSHMGLIVPSAVSRTGPVIGGAASVGSEITCRYIYSLVADGSTIANGANVANGFKLH